VEVTWRQATVPDKPEQKAAISECWAEEDEENLEEMEEEGQREALQEKREEPRESNLC